MQDIVGLRIDWLRVEVEGDFDTVAENIALNSPAQLEAGTPNKSLQGFTLVNRSRVML